MAQEVDLPQGGEAKIRSFGVGALLAVVTLGIYYLFWYYFINSECKDIGVAKDDRKLAESKPGMSLVAVMFGGILIIPPYLSIYNYGTRVRRAQKISGVPDDKQASPVLIMLSALFGFLIIPYIWHFWYVTKHQNRAIRAAGGLDPED